jgi:hypothetical protein
MSFTGKILFDLLPAYYRTRDSQLAAAANLARGPLQSLLLLIAEQVGAVEEDLGQLYDDQFIETCAPWVIPYIGDLIGYQSVKGIAAQVANPRAEVAHTISFRRRKGTALVLEQLARDVTGWGAHAVEFFQLLVGNQYMNHIRLRNHGTADLHGWKTRGYIESGFDATAHTVDVRRIAIERGKYNIQNIGIFLWSLNSYPLQMATLAGAASVMVPATSSGNAGSASSSNSSSSGAQLASQCFRFNTAGRDAPLFNNPISQGSDITAPANPSNVPDRIKRHVLCSDIQQGSRAVYYGEGKSLALYVNGVLLSPYQIQVCNLSGPDGAWINVPRADGPYAAAIDPELGRVALAPVAVGVTAPLVQASFCYGFSGDIGGGGYPRNDAPTNSFVVTNSPVEYSSAQNGSQTLLDTLLAAIGQLPAEGGQVAVEITDNGIYTLAPESSSAAVSPLAINVPAGATVELRAADDLRPTLIIDGSLQISGGNDSSFYLNGLLLTCGSSPPSAACALVAAPASAADGSQSQLGTLGITHCTLVPGGYWQHDAQGVPQPLYGGLATLVAECAGLNLQIASSIVGAIQASELVSVSASNSIIDANDRAGVAYVGVPGIGDSDPAPGGTLTLIGCTVIGKVRATLLSLVSDSVVWASDYPDTVVPGDGAVATHGSSSSSGSSGSSGSGGISGLVSQSPSSNSSSGSGGSASSSGPGGFAPPPWSASLWASRDQQGCVRFSFLPLNSIVPLPFKCVVESIGAPVPLFASLRYGDPGYCKLFHATDDSIRRGADDSGEMGAFHFVLAPLRETDLSIRIQEYMPVGLEFGIFYQT